MKRWRAWCAGLTLLASAAFAQGADCPDTLNHTFKRLHADEDVNLCDLAGQPVLVVNTASFCGFTGQFEGLEALYQRFRDRGLEIVGVPSGDFNQEARDEAETAEVCYANYGVTFTMTSPQSVRGSGAHPMFRLLAAEAGTPPRWNFHKYLLDADGKVVAQFPSQVAPQDARLVSAVESVLPDFSNRRDDVLTR
ncbi:glutathione peroxidase [Isoalcanivorax indicus]|uniref:glutathione peroxidase n=1 Tax=Isoalcanivorax indicus TaxID=2202653 RepID=UPI001FE578EB|nr:redoxin domain-containing protein [Isoalcanivorax indicus]